MDSVYLHTYSINAKAEIEMGLKENCPCAHCTRLYIHMFLVLEEQSIGCAASFPHPYYLGASEVPGMEI